ncbi:TIM barrel protein [soil metagenome]
MPGTLELAANVSIMFTELPYLERFAAAADAGFQSAESWWPFPSAVPDAADVDSFVAAVDASGIPLSALNLFGGDLPAGERGLASRPDRRAEFAANLELVVRIAERTGCRGFNALYGQRLAGYTAAEQDDLAADNLADAATRLAAVGGTVFVEPLSRDTLGDYPIHTAADAVAVVTRVRERSALASIGLLFDTFHLAGNGEDLVAAVRRSGRFIEHVQLADSPGRGEPGTGTVDFAAVLDALWDGGYRKVVACEYAPTGLTSESLGALHDLPHIALGGRAASGVN